MEVHKAITAHSKKQQAAVSEFLQLEARREAAIETAVMLCRNNQPFSVDAINAVTKEINMFAKDGVVPERKYVTLEMVKEYVERLNRQE
ncbi:YpbS family protein [Ectobacillus sp. JY-23]|uniref:YpbS family protein n=1 Tax=Ectobacillus sp. JY-23 TaxID=2933872 RepID=UPI001FF1DC38|nr:YpbS family protein [Ectobacillus sp. JY-23]UOY93414.1 YpbS family protein [Ectobacillus sp. JY-23]